MPAKPAVVLCVDDDEMGLSVRKLLLESQGYMVLTAQSGHVALELLRSHAVDLVVLDYYMPGMDGGMLAAEIKRTRPGLPVLMLSAYSWLPPEAIAAVDAFLTKGDAPDVLFDKMQELLSSS